MPRPRLALVRSCLAAAAAVALAGPEAAGQSARKPQKTKPAAATADEVRQTAHDLEADNLHKAEALSADVKGRLARAKRSVGLVSTGSGWGTGFVVAPGVLATNAHVIRRALAK